MHEKNRNTSSEVSYTRRIESHDPAFFTYESPALGVVEIPGSIYLGDAHSEAERFDLDASSQRFDIVDLRSAPEDQQGRLWYGQVFSRSVDFLVIQGEPDWELGTGFKGLRQGESLTIGRSDPVSSQRFNLTSPEISRKHVTVYATEQGIAVEDEGSANGTSYVSYDKPSDTLRATRQDLTSSVAEHATAQTERILGRAMSDQEVAKWDHYVRSTIDSQYESVRDLLDNPDLRPVTGIEIDGMSFLFSEIIEVESRKMAIGYVSGGDTPGMLRPRLFYQSKSDGGWRASPGIDDLGNYSKGGKEYYRNVRDEHGGYVQITKPSEDIVAVLERQDRLQQSYQVAGRSRLSHSELQSLMSESEIDEQQGSSLSDEVTITRVESRNMDAYVSGVGFKYGVYPDTNPQPESASLHQSLRSMELPDGFEPDFARDPAASYRVMHTLAGEAEVEVFPASLSGRPVEWHVAHDVAKNRVWVDRIVYLDSKVTSYGTQQEVIVAGALSAKPFDYIQQSGGMKPGRDWVEHDRVYGDVSPTLDQIPAIVRYRMARRVFAK